MPGLFHKDDHHIYQLLPWLEIEWLEHGFGTRWSTGWNRRTRLASLTQVHSDICVYAGGHDGRIGRGDALITDVPGATIAVRTADCIPVLLVDMRNRAVAAVHAGWRGTVRGIAAKTVAAMSARFGTRSRDLMAAVGPGIGPCCYEVGPEVAAQFRDWFPERTDLESRAHVDLAEANRRQLAAAGVQERRIWVAGLCTCCSGDEFFSWRREHHRTGRMIAAVCIKKQFRRGQGIAVVSSKGPALSHTPGR